MLTSGLPRWLNHTIPCNSIMVPTFPFAATVSVTYSPNAYSLSLRYSRDPPISHQLPLISTTGSSIWTKVFGLDFVTIFR